MRRLITDNFAGTPLDPISEDWTVGRTGFYLNEFSGRTYAVPQYGPSDQVWQAWSRVALRPVPGNVSKVSVTGLAYISTESRNYSGLFGVVGRAVDAHNYYIAWMLPYSSTSGEIFLGKVIDDVYTELSGLYWDSDAVNTVEMGFLGSNITVHLYAGDVGVAGAGWSNPMPITDTDLPDVGLAGIFGDANSPDDEYLLPMLSQWRAEYVVKLGVRPVYKLSQAGSNLIVPTIVQNMAAELGGETENGTVKYASGLYLKQIDHRTKYVSRNPIGGDDSDPLDVDGISMDMNTIPV